MSITSYELQRLVAQLSIWENEGGARANVGWTLPRNTTLSEDPPFNHAELMQLRVRMVALENLLIGLLQEAAMHATPVAMRRAASISPRPGYTRHPVTLNAAAQMLHLAAVADAPDGDRVYEPIAARTDKTRIPEA